MEGYSLQGSDKNKERSRNEGIHRNDGERFHEIVQEQKILYEYDTELSKYVLMNAGKDYGIKWSISKEPPPPP